MSKHTPGPWWATDHGVRDVGGYIAHTNSVQRYLGQEERYAFEVAQREADKRLIASAPALLEALQRIAGFTLSQFMGPNDMALECVNVASAAIAAATAQAGEQHG